MGFGGSVGIRRIRGSVPAPISWKVRNAMRPTYVRGLAAFAAARAANRLGVATMDAALRAVKIDRDGRRVDYGVVCRRLVTTAFVNYVVDQLQSESSTFGDFKYHDAGVGTTDPAVGDTGIETTDGESRATGSQTEGASANIYKSVGTIAYTTSKAVTEHGLFNDASAGTLMDRSEFAAINVVNGDSIEFTYELTVSAGG
jgi:hypothetical protein